MVWTRIVFPMYSWILIVILSGMIAVSAAAPSVDLTGTVVDESSSPIAGAIVRVSHSDLADTTNTDGTFHLQGVAAPALHELINGPGNSGALFYFHQAPRGGLTVRLRSVSGRTLKHRTLSAGTSMEHALVNDMVEGISKGLYLIELQSTDRTIHAPLLKMDGGWNLQRPSATATKPHTGGITRGSVGALEVTAIGFELKTVGVESWTGSVGTIQLVADQDQTFVPGEDTLDLSEDNRKGDSVEGLPVFDDVGVGAGSGIPEVPEQPTAEATDFGVVANDGQDDSDALQQAIDDLIGRSGASASNPAVLGLPAGRILLTREIIIQADHVVIRGRGNTRGDPQSTTIVLRPSTQMRYDKIDNEGVPDIDAMSHSGNSMGWNWPGRGTFRVQTTEVAEQYQDDHSSAPANRKDIYEGSINFHWASGLDVDQSVTYAARKGDRVIALDEDVSWNELDQITQGSYVWIGAANSEKMYREQHVPEKYWERLHMKVQIFRVVGVNKFAKEITIDKPLEFDLPANSGSDGSNPIGGSKPYPSRVTPLKMVKGVGFENFVLTMELNGLPKLGGGTYSYTVDQATGNYGNMAPEYAMHGLVFKWAVDCWVRNVSTFMTGSHPLVTEQARNIQVVHSSFDGSWNKGGGGNGYFRLSRAWDCLVHDCVLRNLRHLTLQWSSSGNVIIGNDMDCEINFHGGWERHNLVENNLIRIPYGHAHTNCDIGCDHLNGIGAGETWYPIYWATGPKAGKWSGSTGPRNILFNNVMQKQETPDGPYVDYDPYYTSNGSSRGVIFLFAWDRETTSGSHWVHLHKDGEVLQDWAGNENVDYSQEPHRGVNANLRYNGTSMFLENSPIAVPPGS